MRGVKFSLTARALWCAGALAMATWALGAEPQNTDQARIHELQRQVDALDLELARLKVGDPAAQQQAMQSHWSMMQTYLRSIWQMPGIAGRGRGDWMMMDPGMMGGGMIGQGTMHWPICSCPDDHIREAIVRALADAVVKELVKEHPEVAGMFRTDR